MDCLNCDGKMEEEKDFDPMEFQRGLKNSLHYKCHGCGREEQRVQGRKPVILCEGAENIIQKFI